MLAFPIFYLKLLIMQGVFMKTIMMNMVRIFDNDGRVVVLDKKKVYGWEGLTFPGGKVEPFESFDDAAIREVKEETNLDVKDLEFNGIIQWLYTSDNSRYVGLLYTSKKYSGQLIEENKEGKLFFEDYEKFKKMEGHSWSMKYLLDIFDGKFFEITLTFDDDNELKEVKRIK